MLNSVWEAIRSWQDMLDADIENAGVGLDTDLMQKVDEQLLGRISIRDRHTLVRICERIVSEYRFLLHLSVFDNEVPLNFIHYNLQKYLTTMQEKHTIESFSYSIHIVGAVILQEVAIDMVVFGETFTLKL